MSDAQENRNWTEDASHENGRYQNRCCKCKEIFIGHKRRVVCKLCAPSDKVTTQKGWELVAYFHVLLGRIHADTISANELLELYRLFQVVVKLSEEGLESRGVEQALRDRMFHLEQHAIPVLNQRIATPEQQLEAEQGFRDKAEKSAILARAEVFTTNTQLTAAKERIAAAPHAGNCASNSCDVCREIGFGPMGCELSHDKCDRYRPMICNCWKSAAMQDGGTSGK